MKLSIAVVTWNRSAQLIEALRSCVDCEIPSDTQFVIIDNASTDNTEAVVRTFFENNKYDYYYEKLSENIGCGNGRNYAYQKTKGDYVYVLDDDAYIDTDNCKHFFMKAIEIMDSNKQIKTLTTQIYDLVWKRDRVDSIGPKITNGLYKIYMFCGGSHFLSREFFGEQSPYYANKYGYEEIFPSLSVYDAGYVNAFAENLLIIHNPKINKWDENSKEGVRIGAMGIAQTYVMRAAKFPLIIRPLNLLALIARLIQRRSWPIARQTFVSIYEIKNRSTVKSVKYSTVFRLFKDFKLSIF